MPHYHGEKESMNDKLDNGQFSLQSPKVVLQEEGQSRNNDLKCQWVM